MAVKQTEIVLLRNSEVNTFKSCRQKWDWAYNHCLTSKQDRLPLVFGTLVHAALEAWYIPGKKRGVHPAKTFRKLWAQYLKDGGEDFSVKIGRDSPGKEGTRMGVLELGVDMMNGYIKEYGKDEHYEVIAPEMSFQVDVHHSKTGKYLFTAVGQIDLTVRDLRTNRIGFLEHKTGAGLSPFGAPEELDEQSGTYWTYGPTFLRSEGYLPDGEDVDFLQFNRLKKSVGDVRPVNELGQALNMDGKTVSKKQPAARFKRSIVYRGEADRRSIIRRSKAVMREMRLAREGKLQIYKNPDRHCGYCEFKDMCEAEETGNDWESIRDMMMNTWDPYEDHVGMSMSDPE